MSVIAYNGITLPYGNLTRFEQTAVRDELGDTDWCMTKFDIQAICLINVNYLSLLAPDLAATNANPATIAGVIRARLLEHKKQLSVTFNGVELIPSRAFVPGFVDAKNGPKPQSCTLTNLTNTTFILNYHIIAHYWERPDVVPGRTPVLTNQPANNVLYNRWTETVDMDNCQITTRTRDGKFVIRSDNVDGIIADEARTQMAVVGVPSGFLRQSSKYTVSPDGLAIAYNVVDKEQFRMPPTPAFEADGDYEEVIGTMGALRYGRVTIHLKGDKATPQFQLMNAAVTVAVTYLAQRGAALPGNWIIIESASLKFKFYKTNEVTFKMNVMQATPSKASRPGTTPQFPNPIFPFLNITTSIPDSPPDSDYMPNYKLRGNNDILLQAARYYDPNFRDNVLVPATGNMSRGNDIGTEGKNP